jgi:hypothetical protein
MEEKQPSHEGLLTGKGSEVALSGSDYSDRSKLSLKVLHVSVEYKKEQVLEEGVLNLIVLIVFFEKLRTVCCIFSRVIFTSSLRLVCVLHRSKVSFWGIYFHRNIGCCSQC